VPQVKKGVKRYGYDGLEGLAPGLEQTGDQALRLGQNWEATA